MADPYPLYEGQQGQRDRQGVIQKTEHENFFVDEREYS
jgi:hypothetical protein